MGSVFTFLIIGLALALLFVNIYFRNKIIKVYKVLEKNRVQFKMTDLFNKKKLEENVLSKYPKSRQDVIDFASHMKNSLLIASLIVVTITIVGLILKSI